MADTNILGAYFAVPVINPNGTVSNEWQRLLIELVSTLPAFGNTNGLLVQIDTDSVDNREIVATSNKIEVTNGDGVSGNPSIDVNQSNVNHDKLLNYVANQHIDWTNTSENFLTTGTVRMGRGVIAAASNNNAFVGGTLRAVTTSVGNVGSGEDNLMSYVVNGEALDTTGYALRITAFGKTAANGNNKTIKLYFGGTLIYTTGAVAANDKDWCVTALVTSTGTGTQVACAEFIGEGTFTNRCFVTPLTIGTMGDITILTTGEATSDDDIVQYGLRVEWLEA